jgi:hypothetical protein
VFGFATFTLQAFGKFLENLLTALGSNAGKAQS